MKLGEVWSSVNSSKIKQHAPAINTCRLAKWVWWVEKARSNKSRFIGFNCACLRQWREIFKLLPKHTKKISQKILTSSEKRLLVANRHYPVWRHPLLREKGVCSQDNMYKYFKNSIIRNPLFTLYYFFYLTMELLEKFMRTTWRRLYCLLLSMILIIMMLMMKWWSDSNDDPLSNSKQRSPLSSCYIILFPRRIICAIL